MCVYSIQVAAPVFLRERVHCHKIVAKVHKNIFSILELDTCLYAHPSAYLFIAANIAFTCRHPFAPRAAPPPVPTPSPTPSIVRPFLGFVL